MLQHEVEIDADGPRLAGTLTMPEEPSTLVIFAHGSGSSRHSPRNRQVARAIQEAGIGTLLFDLLTAEEEMADRYTGHVRFDIELLARRLEHATGWAFAQADIHIASIGYFGASTGGAAALIAAARLQDQVCAVVSRGGRPDLAGPSLGHVTSPTLLVVGERDETVLALNRLAYDQLRCTRELAIIPGATHLFEEEGTLEQAAELAVEWFARHLPGAGAKETGESHRRTHPAS